MNLLNRLISGIFHPLLMATYCSILLYIIIPEVYSPIALETIPYFILAVFVTTAVIPALSVLFLLFTRRISNLEITSQEERSFPFISIGLFYAATTWMFYTKMNVPAIILVMMIAVTVMIFSVFLISLKFKISVHATAIWGVVGMMAAFFMKYLNTDALPVLAGIVICAGITTSSRLYLGRHTPSESWSGAFFGFLFCFAVMYFLG